MQGKDKLNLLIVDDETEVREVIREVLTKQNIACETAPNAETAIDILKTNKFQAVLCDIHMPDIDGLECLASAVALGVTAPFVFLTGFTDQKLILRANRIGAFDFLSKPFDFEEVTEVMQRALYIGARKEEIRAEIEKNCPPEAIAKIRQAEKAIALKMTSNSKRRLP